MLLIIKDHGTIATIKQIQIHLQLVRRSVQSVMAICDFFVEGNSKLLEEDLLFIICIGAKGDSQHAIYTYTNK